jgi:PBSX family phage terminase large subunit
MIIQEQFSKLFTEDLSKYRYIVLMGTRGSGKSFAVATKMLQELQSNKYMHYAMVRNYQGSIKESQYREFKSVAHEYLDNYKLLGRPPTIINKYTGNDAISIGAINIENRKSYSGLNRAWIEEANQITKYEFMNLDGTIRHGEDCRLFLTFNPPNYDNWITEYFFDNGTFLPEFNKWYSKKVFGNRALIMRSSYLDNDYCTEEQRSLYESYKDIDINLYNSYTLGLFSSGNIGLIFREIDYNEYQQTSGKYNVIYCDQAYSYEQNQDYTCIIKATAASGHFIDILEVMIYRGIPINQTLDNMIGMSDNRTLGIYIDGSVSQSTTIAMLQNEFDNNKVWQDIKPLRFALNKDGILLQNFWNNSRIRMPFGFNKTHQGKLCLNQLYCFEGVKKRAGEHDDFPDALLGIIFAMQENNMLY